MDHVAILSKRLKLKDKILTGDKTIESRWYRNKITPYSRIKVGDRVYFKETGGDIDTVSIVSKVIQFENLDNIKIRQIINKYYKFIGLSKKDLYTLCKDKKYCILIYLENSKKVKPFKISKKGFGNSTAWIGPVNIDDIAIKE